MDRKRVSDRVSMLRPGFGQQSSQQSIFKAALVKSEAMERARLRTRQCRSRRQALDRAVLERATA